MRSRLPTVLTVGVALAVAGCSTPPAQTSSTSSRPTTATVAPDRLDSVLLSVQEADAIMGASGMDLIGTINHQTFTKNLPTASNLDCLSTANVALDPVYADSGYSAIVEERLQHSGPDFQPTHVLEQAVASFPSADLARAFVEHLAGKWKGCAAQTITLRTIPTTGGVYSEEAYTVGGLVGEAPKIALSKTGGSLDCQRALDAVSNLVIDVEACASPLTDQGRQIADKMATKAT